MENWKEFYKNSRTSYEVSDLGNVRNAKTKHQWKLSTNSCGYSTIKIDGNWFLVHRLVAKFFIGDIDGKVVNHLNNNPSDNAVENLEITTQSNNMLHMISQNRHKGHNQYKL
jgi:hypothetical protein